MFNALSFVLGAGVGMGIVFLVWLIFGRPRAPSLEQKLAERQRREESTVYFGRDAAEHHPDDIERAYAHRYDGMTDGKAGYVPSGLDFGRYPR